MKVCFVVNDVALSGGVGVVLEHAYHLADEHDFDVTLAVRESLDVPWSYKRLEKLRVVALDEARSDRFDVAVATWWRTTYDLFSIDARRYAYFVQSLEDRFYPEDAVDRVQAAVTHDLPVAFLTEARWIAETLGDLCPDAQCFYVRNGISKDVFRPITEVRPHLEGPLRILVEGHPDVWFKAVPDALAATSNMTRPRDVTLVAPTRERTRDLPVDRVVGPLQQTEMAALYGEVDVLVKLSRVEGMFGPPLEGFHRGATCIVTPVTGHDEYVRHGWNGIVSAWDDNRAAARWLDLLADDRRLLHFLRINAAQTAAAWPSWTQASTFMAAALRAIAREAPPDAPAAALQMLRDVTGATEGLRNERLVLEQIVRTQESDLRLLAGRHQAVLGTRAYRFGVVLRDRLWNVAPVRMVRLPIVAARAVAARARGFLQRVGR